MNRLGPLAALASAALAAALLTGLGPASAAEESPDPRVLTGTVVDPAGIPVAGARVEVFAVDTNEDGDTQTLQPIALARSNAAGGIVVAGKLQRQVRFNPDGSVPLEIRVTTRTDLTKLFNLDAVPPAQPGGHWTWGDQVDQELVEGGEDAAAEQARGEVTRLVLNMADAAFQPFEPGRIPAPRLDGQVGTLATADPDGFAACKQRNWYSIVWKWSGKVQDRLTPIQKIDTFDHALVKYKWADTKKTKWQIAYTGSSTYRGGMSYANTQVLEQGFTASVGNSFNGGWTVNTRFRHFRQYCTNHEWVDTQAELDQYGYYSGQDKWQSHKWLGGHEGVEHYDMYYCWNGAPPQKIGAGGSLWVARTSTSRIGGFFGVGGVQLDTSQQNSTSYKFTIRPDAQAEYILVCGNNNTPLEASKVREVRY
jgi:hypothetical protein